MAGGSGAIGGAWGASFSAAIRADRLGWLSYGDDVVSSSCF